MKKIHKITVGAISIAILAGSVGYVTVKQDLLASLYSIFKTQESGSFTEKYDAKEYDNKTFSNRFYIQSNGETFDFVFPDQNDKKNMNKYSKITFTADQYYQMESGNIILPNAEQSELLHQQTGEDYRFMISQSTQPGKENEQMFYVNLNGTAYGVKGRNNESVDGILSNSNGIADEFFSDALQNTSTNNTSANTTTNINTTNISTSSNNTINSGGSGYSSATYYMAPSELSMTRSDFANDREYNEYKSRLNESFEAEKLGLPPPSCGGYYVYNNDCSDSFYVSDCRGSPRGSSSATNNLDYDRSSYSRDQNCNTCNDNPRLVFHSGQTRTTGSIGQCFVERCINGTVIEEEVDCDRTDLSTIDQVKAETADFNRNAVDIEAVKNGEGFTPGLSVSTSPVYGNRLFGDSEASSRASCGSAPYTCASGTLYTETSATGSEYKWSCSDSTTLNMASGSVNCSYPRGEEAENIPSYDTSSSYGNSNLEPINGACGSNGGCSSGSASGVYDPGDGREKWKCSGENGGTTAHCWN